MLADSDRDDLVVVDGVDPPAPDQQTVEVRADDGDALLEFHGTCMEQGVTLTVRRIYRESDEPPEPGIGVDEDRESPQSVD